MNFAPLIERIGGTSLAGLAEPLSPQSLGRIRHGDFRRWRALVGQLPRIQPASVDFSMGVRIGGPEDCDAATQDELRRRLLEFRPWRKGPFSVFGIEIDSEWRSGMKWARLDGKIEPLAGRKLLDVGCGNGYYGLRMLGAGAAEVIGIDQHIPYVMQFEALKSFAPDVHCWVLPMPFERFPGQSEYFDTAFSMGVLYHLRSPLDHLLRLRDCLRPGGELVLETLCVEGGEGYALTPAGRYARMGKVWFVPSPGTLERWLQRCGFVEIAILDRGATTVDEQRKTQWMPFESLADALDGNDSSRTVEGYPAPARMLLSAKRPA